ncbi:MAG: DUF6522 family protein [Pseudotabrizicola sp.]|uniref:DUF6522 family protein n=1 Tax=Pseudotabrizicola sp. TaxID=2939647 RepID=UPI00271F1779|nr:DUF6522 family protein [Pseudotabrizicola sp.]MDO8884372.1 DUF6522 family protein [Pseudotabrizicola sp.]MDP2080285.1 DUF6522 family protein [Pseudotabrizicola sp.]MDZ7575370.1 DUF6522 family protein [Pseudotabrizicola sp.]
MTVVTITTNGFEVDASVIASAFGIDPSTLQARMRAGEVTSLCEAGVDADLGRFRLTFRHAGRALRLTVDADGQVLTRAMFPVGVAKANRTPPAD